MIESLTPDTQSVLLLCGNFGVAGQYEPLSLKDYNKLANWLFNNHLRPSDLLADENIPIAAEGANLSPQRLDYLLHRGAQLANAVERWQRSGIWIISRSDQDYPKRYKKQLGNLCPPLLFGAGNKMLFRGSGCAIVGSRNVDDQGAAFAQAVARLLAENGESVISGGARGVDQISMDAALEAGGIVIGVLAENLLKRILQRETRNYLEDERLLLISPYYPEASFAVWRAMDRNKLIYALADFAIIVSATANKGGTWAGAIEEFNRKNGIPLLVRQGENVPEGNKKLSNMGLFPYPDNLDKDNFRQTLATIKNNWLNRSEIEAGNGSPDKDTNLVENSWEATVEEILADSMDKPVEIISNTKVEEDDKITELKSENSSEDIINQKQEENNIDQTKPQKSFYEEILPYLLARLQQPLEAKTLAQSIDVASAQVNKWLKQAVKEGKAVKLKNPVRYQAIAEHPEKGWLQLFKKQDAK